MTRVGLVNIKGDFIGFTQAEIDDEWQKVEDAFKKRAQMRKENSARRLRRIDSLKNRKDRN